MKNIYLIIPALLFSVFANAKGGGVQTMTTGGIGGTTGGFPHFNSQQNSTLPKGSLRLIGKTFGKFENSVFIPADSTAYHFNSDRGGVINPDDPNNDETVLYDEAYTYLYVDNKYSPRLHRLQEYYSANKVKLLEFETWKASIAGFADSAKYDYTYSNEGKMIGSTLSQWYGNMWTNPVASDIIYTDDKVTELITINYRAEFIYDANNRLTSVIDKEWLSGVWRNKEKNIYNYTNNEMESHTLVMWNEQTLNWENSKRWQYSYNNGKVMTKLELIWTGSEWRNNESHLFGYDVNGNKISDLTSVWNSNTNVFENSKKLTYEYNSQDLSEIITEQSWNGNAWVNADGDIQYRYYYQNYFPSDVKTVPVASANLKLYPIPANTTLNVDAQFENTQFVNVTIYDIRGMLMLQLSEKSSEAYKKQLDISQLPSGNYILRVGNEKTILTEQFTVSR